MACPHCGRKAHDPTPPCPNCPHEAHSVEGATTLPAVNKETEPQSGPQAVEPEILAPGEPEGRQNPFFHSSTTGQDEKGQARFIFTSWQNMGGGTQGAGQFFSASRPSSCLPGALTMVLMLLLGMRFGALASLGFLVFYGVGSALAFAATLQRAMRGQQTSPWLSRALVWTVAAGITVALAGGL